MRLVQLTLENWGPFYGRTTIPLSVSAEAPVILVYGENGFGKTSLLRALVWCLYGRIARQDGLRDLQVGELVNTKALADGAVNFSVALRVEDGARTIDITRSGQAQYGVDEVTPQTAHVRARYYAEGESALPEQEIRAAVDRLLPEAISDFFLFDGEMLKRFEERLRSDSSDSRRFVRKQIERALGLPFMDDLVRELTALNREVEAEINKDDRARRSAQRDADDLADLVHRLEVKRGALAKASEAVTEYDKSIRDDERRLRQFESAARLFGQRDVAEADLRQQEATLAAASAEVKAFAEETWWFPIAAKADAARRRMAETLEVASRQNRKRAVCEHRLGQIDSEMVSRTCSHCGHALNEETLLELSAEQIRLRGELSQFEDVNVEDAASKLRALQAIGGPSDAFERLQDLDGQREHALVQVQNTRRLVQRLNDELAGAPTDLPDVQRRLEDNRVLRDRAIRTLTVLEGEVAGLESERRSKLSKRTEALPAGSALRARQRTYESALRIVEGAYADFRETMREKIEDLASAIFRSLISDKSLAGIRVGPDYSLSIITGQGSVMREPSAGQTQVMTMAFIGALGSASDKDAPLVLDTPLGRLDVGHRDAILDWLSRRGDQVLMFVQSGEFDEEDRRAIADRIGREYRLNRISTELSEVVAV